MNALDDAIDLTRNGRSRTMDPMTGTANGDLLSTTEAGRRLGITTREVYDLIDAGELPGVRTDHGMQVPAAAVDSRT